MPIPDRAIEAGLDLHAQVQGVGGFERRAVQAFGAGHVEVGFVDRGHFDLRRERAEHFVDFLGTFPIALGMAIDENRVGTHFSRGAQGHGGMHTELAGFIGGGGDDTTLVALSAHYDRFAF